MTFCVFCSENIPSDQLESHMNQYHSTFLPSHSRSHSKSTSNHSFNSKHTLSSTHHITPPISSVGHVYDPDILKPLCFLDGKRIKENIKKHKREEKSSKHHKRPYKRRKLNDFSSDTHTKNKKKTKNKRKKKKQESAEQQHTAVECEVEEEGEEDAYGGLPYHFHLATHCEPKFDPTEAIHTTRHTNIRSLLNPQHNASHISTPTSKDVPPTMSPCAFNPIHYDAKDHLTLRMNDRDHDWTKQLIESYDRTFQHKRKHKHNAQDHWSDTEDVTQCVVYPNECDMEEKALNDLILADLEQYNFITNPLTEAMLSAQTQKRSVSSSVPPLVTVPESDSPEIIIHPPSNKSLSKSYGIKKKTRIEKKNKKAHTKSTSNDRRATMNTSHLTLPTLQTPKQTHRPSPNVNNIPPLKAQMLPPSNNNSMKALNNTNLSLINVNNLNNLVRIAQNKNIAQNISIGANSHNVTVLKLNQINDLINAQQPQKNQATFHRFNRRNNNNNNMVNHSNNSNRMHRSNGHGSTAQILSIQDAMSRTNSNSNGTNNHNPNASPTASNTTSNSTNSMNSMNTINIISDNDDTNNSNNSNNMLMNAGILSVLRKKLMNQNAHPTFQQQLNGNYTLRRYHQEVNGKNTNNNNNLSLLNNFNVNKFTRK